MKRLKNYIPAFCQSQLGYGSKIGDAVDDTIGTVDSVAGTPFFHRGVLMNSLSFHRSMPSGITLEGMNCLNHLQLY